MIMKIIVNYPIEKYEISLLPMNSFCQTAIYSFLTPSPPSLSLCLSLSISLSLFLSLFISLFLSLYLSLFFSLFLFLSLSVSLSYSLSLSHSLSISVSLTLSLSFSLSLSQVQMLSLGDFIWMARRKKSFTDKILVRKREIIFIVNSIKFI